MMKPGVHFSEKYCGTYLCLPTSSLPPPYTQIEYGDWNSLGGNEVEAKEALHRFCPRKFIHLALEHDQRYLHMV